MKSFLLAALLICVSIPAFADNVTIVRREGDEVINLPGNAQIVQNPSYGDDGIRIYTNDDNIVDRALFGQKTRIYRGARVPEGTPLGAVNVSCPATLKVSDRNKCVRDVIKLQKKYNRKMND